MENTTLNLLKGLCPNLLALIHELGGKIVDPTKPGVPFCKPVQIEDLQSVVVSHRVIYVVTDSGVMFEIQLQSNPLHRAALIVLALQVRIMKPVE